ncbi:MAG: ABC transporter substrate-binding protein [Lachnospiraceae bacterium]|nr:ABC transporter substrate-binding protein [Lachnospiraceae bacterium]
MKRIKAWLLTVAFVLPLAACDNYTDSNMPLYNSPQADEIYIGVAYPMDAGDEETYFYKGVDLAVDEINVAGGVLGKKLRIVVRDDHDDTQNAMQIATTFFEQGITAVVGHWGTDICYLLADIYDANAVVMVTPQATGMSLFDNEYQYVYRMIANNQELAQAIAQHISEAGLSRAAIYFSDNEYGNDFAATIENELSKKNVVVIDRVTSITPANSKAIMDRWKAFGCDSVIVAESPPGFIEPVQLIYEADSRLPIYGADNFGGYNLPSLLGEAGCSLYMASYPLETLAPRFLAAFRAAYGHDPCILAVSGYDSVFLLRNAMEAVGTTDSTAIAAFLSELQDYSAASGSLSYNKDTQEFDGFKVAVSKLIP